jgi:positive regulator of sigma E activity
MLRQINKKEEKQMEEAVLMYLVVPFIAVLGVHVVGTTIYQLFGVPAIVLFGAVGGIAFFAKFFRR